MSTEAAPAPGKQSAFGERYEVLTTSPLPEFKTHGGEAFKASDKENPKVSIYAIVHHPTVPVRNEFFKSLKSSPIPSMINPIDRGLMNVSIGGVKQRLVTIFSRPSGGALLSEDGTLHPRVSAGNIRQNLVLAALKVLTTMHKRGISHRRISATRIYFATPDSDDIVFGECYSAPAGYKVPYALEPLELSFADDVARGEGGSWSDYYQLGAAIQCLHFGENLWQGRTASAIAMARINQSSFWALSGGRDIPGAIGTLIRGLMADELDERWAAEDVLDWFEGVGKLKRTSMESWTMSRPTSFNGVAYVDRRLLADAFGRNPSEAASFLKAMDFPAWIQSSFRDEIFTERTEHALDVRPSEGYGGPRADDYKMVSRVCMFLHPTGPIYYKDYALMLSGLPSLMAEAFSRDDREKMSSILEIFDPKYVSAIVEIVGERQPKLQAQFNHYRTIISHGTSKQLGRGLERVLYEMNPILPCISLRFNDVWIGSITQLMRALDRLSAKGGAKNILLDRHVAAFCAAHGGDLARDFNNLAAVQSNPAKFNSLTAEFFGKIQRQLNLEPLPALLEKLVDGLVPAVRGLKNKKRREAVQNTLEKLKKTGDIAKLITELNMTKLQALDAREFLQASNLVSRLDREKKKLTGKILPTDRNARLKGYKGATTVALLSFAIVATFTFLGLT